MRRHLIETCADDLDLLAERLDALARDGGRIISVIRQPTPSTDGDQVAALDGRGSYVIIVETESAALGVVEARAVEAGAAQAVI